MTLSLSTLTTFTTINVQSIKNKQETTIEITHQDETTITITTWLPVYKTRIIQTAKGDFTLFEIKEEGYSTQIGEAKLPKIRRIIEIPQGATPRINVLSTNWEKINLQKK